MSSGRSSGDPLAAPPPAGNAPGRAASATADPAFARVPAAAKARIAAGEGSPVLLEPLLGTRERERALAHAALERLKELGVDYGDLRLGRDHSRHVMVLDENLASHGRGVSAGIGVRALVGGFWGFAASDDLTPDGAARCAERAVVLAKAVGVAADPKAALRRDQLAKEPAHRVEIHTPVGICPFTAEVEELAAEYRAAAAVALAKPGVKRVGASLPIYGRRRLFASTEGAEILTTHCVTDLMQRVTVVDQGTSAYRTMVGNGALAGGLEHYLAADFPGNAARAAEEARLKCGAKRPEPGKYTLILDGHNLALTMHESVGHPTELDRVLGYERGFAGGSFASLEKLGNFRYGSPLVNFTADNTVRYGGASVGFDDEGVQCSRFPVIQEGILVGYGTSRETAHRVGQTRANGTCRSTHWYDAPIVRIPNLYLEPGRAKLSTEQLIADTEDGILMLGRDSFSIDQMRLNFQFGADMCWRIKGGKLVEPLRDVIYQSMSPEFWSSMDAVCDASEFQMHGVFNCGKGQPMQAAKMLHGAAPARFRDIKVGF
jgi:TldD protein